MKPIKIGQPIKKKKPNDILVSGGQQMHFSPNFLETDQVQRSQRAK